MKDISSKDISIPEDSCVSLTLKTDGSMFHASGLTDSKIRSRKWFMNTVSKRISESAKPDECQVCQCVADHTGMAKSVCRTCYTKVSDVSSLTLNVRTMLLVKVEVYCLLKGNLVTV